MPKVIVGMSGGVDSAVTAYLLKAAGYDVTGVTLRNWVAADGGESRCCEIDAAREICDVLGIPYYVKNCLAEFRKYVTEPFVCEYLQGITPNPCIVCNRYVKWEMLLQAAADMGAGYVATGHYAEVVHLPSGRYTVRMAAHAEKDQTYMLYRLTQEQLARTIMPLGRTDKAEVRRIAAEAGIPVADKPDSQEICFVTDGRYSDYIEAHTETELPGAGDFIDLSGKVVGRHKGAYRYTTGQRRGLGIALGYPAYVREINMQDNTVTVGDESALYAGTVICRDTVFMSAAEPAPGARFRAAGRIRYHHKAQAAEAEMLGDGRMKIVFDEPVRSPAPGQSAVLYDADGCVICGGFIERAVFAENA